jgi:hypothetical protein
MSMQGWAGISLASVGILAELQDKSSHTANVAPEKAEKAK